MSGCSCDVDDYCDVCRAADDAEFGWMRKVSKGAVTGRVSYEDALHLVDAGRGHLMWSQ